MVNRVNGNDYYDYSKLKMPDAADKTGNGEKFSLNYQRAQEEKEDDDKDKEGRTKDGDGVKASGINGQRTVMQSGVRLELSGNTPRSSAAKGDNVFQTGVNGQRLLDSFRSWVTVFVQTLKDFFYKIWNDEPAQDNSEFAEDVDTMQETSAAQNAATIAKTGESGISEPERLTEEYLIINQLESLKNPEDAARRQIQHKAEQDKEIQKYLRSGNLEQVINLVTQNGQKTIAKNSTLLTYYDRTGRITPLNVSDQERILHGDRNVKKL